MFPFLPVFPGPDKTGTVQTETEAVLTLYQQGMKKKTNVGTTSGRTRTEDEAARHERNAQWTRLAEKASRAPPARIKKKDVDPMIRYLRRKGAPGRDEIPGWTYLLMHARSQEDGA